MRTWKKFINDESIVRAKRMSYHFELPVAVLHGEMLLLAFLRVMQTVFDDVEVRQWRRWRRAMQRFQE